MAYKYENLRAKLFTEENQKLFLKIRDQVERLLKASGAVRMEEAVSGCSGDGWDMIACVDRLVELREIREITQVGTPGQYRIFVSARGE